MDPISQQTLLATAGATGEVSLYVDDVFSTYTYEGTAGGAAQTISNGLDLSGEGGLVWIKSRDVISGTYAAANHVFTDTERGANKLIFSSSSSAEQTGTYGVNSFNSSGFGLTGGDATNNADGYKYCSWSFRKAPGFFDVVTYTGTGSGTGSRTISHNLGSVPGMIIIKRTSGTEDWMVYHRSLGASGGIKLNSDLAAYTNAADWYNTAPTATEFTIRDSDIATNGLGETYVAYLFAHDDQSFGTNSNEAIIKCGSYTGTGGSGLNVNIGFEPQFVLVKNSSLDSNWIIFDNIRGMANFERVQIYPNSTSSEYDSGGGNTQGLVATETGFRSNEQNTWFNGQGSTMIYVAIRRPHKPPSTATEVFGISSVFTGNNGSGRQITTGGVTPDLVVSKITNSSAVAGMFTDRIRGGDSLGISGPQGDANSYWILGGWYDLDVMDGYKVGSPYSYSNDPSYSYISYAFKRAPGFFDVMSVESSTSLAQTFNHNLRAAPEFIIAKRTGGTGYWLADQANNYLRLDTDNGDLGTPVFNTLTSTQFSVDAGTFSSGETWIVYLFASLAGISKVGSYTGTGSNINVDCGFTAGARFVLIKRTDSTGDWYVYDSTRGIVSANDPYFLLNEVDGQVTTTDYIDPLNSGFTVTSSAPADLNASGGTYIFLAIA